MKWWTFAQETAGYTANCQDRATRYCVDTKSHLLEAAHHRLQEYGFTNCHFVTGDAFHLSELVSGPADFVFMANAFHGVPDKPRVVHSTLKPGGLFAIINWHQRHREETTILGEPRGPKTELRLSPKQ